MVKKLVLHDLPPEDFKKIAEPVTTGDTVFAAQQVTTGDTVFAAQPIIRPCIGCYGCWLKAPGECVIDDRGKGFAGLMSRHDELVVISRLVFGGFSASVKAVLDRSIGYILPFFKIVNNEMHHDKRFKNYLALRYIFYGDNMTETDKATAKNLVTANAINFSAEEYSIEFYRSPLEVAI